MEASEGGGVPSVPATPAGAFGAQSNTTPVGVGIAYNSIAAASAKYAQMLLPYLVSLQQQQQQQRTPQRATSRPQNSVASNTHLNPSTEAATPAAEFRAMSEQRPPQEACSNGSSRNGTAATSKLVAAAATNTTAPAAAGRILSLDQDEGELSPYQCLARKQIELFAQPGSPPSTDQKKEKSTAEHTRGRNRVVVIGQVGIRCRHCGTATKSMQARGAILFPSTRLGVYQTAQNMTNKHLLKSCKLIPDHIRQQLISLRASEQSKNTCKSAHGGGRQYWADGVNVLGVVETEDRRLRFAPPS